jgi:hypothetical protein
VRQKSNYEDRACDSFSFNFQFLPDGFGIFCFLLLIFLLSIALTISFLRVPLCLLGFCLRAQTYKKLAEQLLFSSNPETGELIFSETQVLVIGSDASDHKFFGNGHGTPFIISFPGLNLHQHSTSVQFLVLKFSLPCFENTLLIVHH